MSTATFLVGDTRAVVAKLPAGSVDLVMTSPPFLALRSYLPAGHPNKHLEIGSEPTPADFLDTMLALTEGWGRVLAPHGSIVVELGDTYAGSGGAGGDCLNAGMRAGQPKFAGSASRGRVDDRKGYGGAADRWDFAKPGTSSRLASGTGWPLDKSLCLISTLYPACLAYGRNLLRAGVSPAALLDLAQVLAVENPEWSAAELVLALAAVDTCPPFTFAPWRVRNLIVWARSNPPVGALGDKFRPATSYLTVATRSRTRWFDLDAVRSGEQSTRGGSTSNHHGTDGKQGRIGPKMPNTGSHPAGAPPLDWWNINPEGFEGSHYATFPESLCIRPVQAMCPRRVCRTCGEPSRRITSAPEYVPSETYRGGSRVADAERVAEGVNQWVGPDGAKASLVRQTATTGWTSCGCEGADGLRLDGFHAGTGWRPGVVLDPFAGTGTVGAVAVGHGRDAILVDLDERNVELARTRLGMFMTEGAD